MTARRLHFEPRSFGRRQLFLAGDAVPASPALSEDLKLFATNYIAGFLLVCLYLL